MTTSGINYLVIMEHAPEDTYIYKYVGDDPKVVALMERCHGKIMNVSKGLDEEQIDFLCSIGDRTDFIELWSTMDDGAEEEIGTFDGLTRVLWMGFAL